MSPATRTLVSVDELTRAWHAIQGGQFRTAHSATALEWIEAKARTAPIRVSGEGWTPFGKLLPVVGCVGSAGASTTALAIATVAGSSRVVECCAMTASGLAAASTAELGQRKDGWTRGRRGEVLIERVAGGVFRVDEIPTPTPVDARCELTVLDVGWEVGQVMATPSWLCTQLLAASTVVAVTPASVPGMRRLEGVLSLLTHTRVIAVVVGPLRRRWPRAVEHSMGPLTRGVTHMGNLVEFPDDDSLAVRGLDSTPLPAALLKATTKILHCAEVQTPEMGTTR